MKNFFSYLMDLVRYRGGPGHWSYLAHRVTGVGVALFLMIHIVDIAFLGWGPEMFNKVMSIYKHPLFKFPEVFLFASVLFHGLNGIRIILVDFWPGATKQYRGLLRGQMILFFFIMVPVTIKMLAPLFAGGKP